MKKIIWILLIYSGLISASEDYNCAGDGGPFSRQPGETAANDLASLYRDIGEYREAFIRYLRTTRSHKMHEGSPEYFFDPDPIILRIRENYRVAVESWISFWAPKYGSLAMSELSTSLSAIKSPFERSFRLQLLAQMKDLNQNSLDNISSHLEVYFKRARVEFSHKVNLDYGNPAEIDFLALDEFYAYQRLHWKDRLSDNQLTVIDLIDTLSLQGASSASATEVILKIYGEASEGRLSDAPFRDAVLKSADSFLGKSSSQMVVTWMREKMNSHPSPNPAEALLSLIGGKHLILNQLLQSQWGSKRLLSYFTAEVEAAVALSLSTFMARSRSKKRVVLSQEFDFLSSLFAHQFISDLARNPKHFPRLIHRIEDTLGSLAKQRELGRYQVETLSLYFQSLGSVKFGSDLLAARIDRLGESTLLLLVEEISQRQKDMHPNRRQAVQRMARILCAFVEVIRRVPIPNKRRIAKALDRILELRIPDEGLDREIRAVVRQAKLFL